MTTPDRFDHVAVLAEPAVQVGVATLANSLIRNGFRGVVWVGYRGQLPAFARGSEVLTATSTCTLRFVPLETTRPFTYYKADFMSLLWARYCPEATSLYYFDTDVIVDREWEFFRSWLSYGLAFCEDQHHWSVSGNSPVRNAWAEVIELAGLELLRECDRYLNAGFVGVPREQRSFLTVWSRLALITERIGDLTSTERHNVTGTRDRGRPPVLPSHVAHILRYFLFSDQAALNMAIMASNHEMSHLGPDGMGFTHSFNFAMAHAIGPLKPWNKPFVRHVLRHGSAPTNADALWWHYASGPIPTFPTHVVRRARLRVAAGKVLGRLIGHDH